MKYLRLFPLMVAGLLALSAPGIAQERATLRVLLYPYVPDARELFFELEQAFEARHPGTNLELVETSDIPGKGVKPIAETYYSGGLLTAQADVYEVDAVLLDEMRRAGKIVPLKAPARSYVPAALAAVTADGQTWAVPHWICGNFLFYRRGDRAVEQAATWNELVELLGPQRAVLADLYGKSTLGEWYLLSLATATGDANELLRKAREPQLDTAAVGRLQRLLNGCPAGLCRSETLHDRAGGYARLFAQGRARAYIGYSETLSYAIEHEAQACDPGDPCLSEDEIAVRAIPPAAAGGSQVGWVDALAIARGLTPERERLARAFVEFATSWEAYRMVLNPEWPSAARYLLPAVLPVDSDPPLQPRLYPDFYRAFGTRLVLSGDRLNDALRARGKQLDCALTPERNDAGWRDRCAATP